MSRPSWPKPDSRLHVADDSARLGQQGDFAELALLGAAGLTPKRHLPHRHGILLLHEQEFRAGQRHVRHQALGDLQDIRGIFLHPASGSTTCSEYGVSESTKSSPLFTTRPSVTVTMRPCPAALLSKK